MEFEIDDDLAEELAKEIDPEESKEIADLAYCRVPEGVDPLDWLPYVRAVTAYWSDLLLDALAWDNPALSARPAEEFVTFQGHFLRLTGREWADADWIGREEVLTFPETRTMPKPKPKKYRCLFCGATYDDRSSLRESGMSCVQCRAHE